MRLRLDNIMHGCTTVNVHFCQRYMQCSRKRVQQFKKTLKVMFFGFWTKKSKKKRKKSPHTFHRPLNHSAFNYSITGSQYRQVTVTIKHLAQKCVHKKLCNWELCVINAY